MSIRILHKRGTSAPTTSDIEQGELAIDYENQFLYSANSTAVFPIKGAAISSIDFGNSTVNAIGNSILLSVRNATSSANHTASGFVAGISIVNTTAHAVGANLIANSSALYIGNSTVNNVINSTSMYMGPTLRTSFSYTSTNTDAQVLDTIDKTAFRSGKYIVTVKNNATNAYQISELLVIHDDSGTDASIIEYGLVFTNAVCATFSANANSTVVRLYTTPVVASSVFRLTKECHVV